MAGAVLVKSTQSHKRERKKIKIQSWGAVFILFKNTQAHKREKGIQQDIPEGHRYKYM